METNASEEVRAENLPVPDNADMIKLLNDIRKNTKRTFVMQCISGLCAVGMLITLVICARELMTLIPQVSEVLTSVDELSIQAEGAIEEVNTMSRSITATSGNLSKLVDDNAELLNEAVTNINNIDFEGLNKAILDLQDAIEPLAAAANALKGFTLNPFGR